MVDTPIGTDLPNYTLVSGDIGATIKCRVTATNAAGSAAAVSNTVGPVIAEPVEAETTAWAAAVVTAGGTVSAGRKTLVNNLIAGLKTDGVWVKLDRLWLLAGENNQSARVDLKGLITCTVVGAPVFTTDRGYTGSSISNYLNTGFAPLTHGVNFIQNSASMFVYDRTSGTNAGLQTGSRTPTPAQSLCELAMYQSGTTIMGHLNTNPFAAITVAAGNNTQGFLIVTRNAASGAGAVNVYKNGSSTPYGTSTGASAVMSNFNFYILASNNNGTAQSATTDQIACVGYGGGLNATQAVALTTRIETYMDAIGAGIIP